MGEFAYSPIQLFVVRRKPLKIVVCVKQVPDTAAKVVAVGGKVNWGDAPLVINPWDEYAVETALQLGDDVTAVTMAEEGPNEALKHALAMGCSEAVLVSGPGAADTQVAAHVLAAAIRKIGDVDLVVFGRQAVDGDSGITAAQTARVLGWPVLSLCAAVSVDGETLKVERSIEEGRQKVEAGLPAVVSVTKDIGEPRYPSFMGIRKASRAEIPTWTVTELGTPVPSSVVSFPDIKNPPAREVVCEMIDEGSPAATAAKLADRILEEKVI
jgi:electron transfer flavoprotein beta subunit